MSQVAYFFWPCQKASSYFFLIYPFCYEWEGHTSLSLPQFLPPFPNSTCIWPWQVSTSQVLSMVSVITGITCSSELVVVILVVVILVVDTQISQHHWCWRGSGCVWNGGRGWKAIWSQVDTKQYKTFEVVALSFYNNIVNVYGRTE